VGYQQEQRLRHVDNQQESQNVRIVRAFVPFGSFAYGTAVVSPAHTMNDTNDPNGPNVSNDLLEI
jgi:hypothetical protein